MSNRLEKETSPYLLQHKDNPVDWYAWGKEAFDKAKREDKPIFLSIGYSTCHWCHVMAHESFENKQIAELLNRYFVSIKVDKEERPDVDSVYMAVCQAFTGSGGWPTSIFMTAEQKPFFAGTYFPPDSRGGMIGFAELLFAIHEKWDNDRTALLEQANGIIKHISDKSGQEQNADIQLCHKAVDIYEKTYDEKNGGFGQSPKFPMAHNILFLLSYYNRYKSGEALQMAEHTLLQMYRGGMFDHIGFGFCRYSTDDKFLVPHFEKMLYDNALLIIAYCKAYTATKKPLYLEIAQKTASFVLREMTSEYGGFYSALDADSQGKEGKYYLFEKDEIIAILGKKDGEIFCRRYGITAAGNFEGLNIPNLLCSDVEDKSLDVFLPKLEEYRKNRFSLHLDDKILTAWNGLMIAAMCELYITTKKDIYLAAAKKADKFIRTNLFEKGELFVSYRDKKRGVKGFLDDYAGYIFALLCLYKATFEEDCLLLAKQLCNKVFDDFADNNGGLFLYGKESEELILRPKETYDGAVPSGNSLMAYNAVTIALLSDNEYYKDKVQKLLDFIARDASRYPIGYAMFLVALMDYYDPPAKVTVVLDKDTDIKALPLDKLNNMSVTVFREATEQYKLKNGKTTYYVCKNNSCKPPVNDLKDVF